MPSWGLLGLFSDPESCIVGCFFAQLALHLGLLQVYWLTILGSPAFLQTAQELAPGLKAQGAKQAGYEPSSKHPKAP